MPLPGKAGSATCAAHKKPPTPSVLSFVSCHDARPLFHLLHSSQLPGERTTAAIRGLSRHSTSIASALRSASSGTSEKLRTTPPWRRSSRISPVFSTDLSLVFKDFVWMNDILCKLQSGVLVGGSTWLKAQSEPNASLNTLMPSNLIRVWYN